MSKRSGVLPPNFTAIPNEILDEMPLMLDAEARVTLATFYLLGQGSTHTTVEDLARITGLSQANVQHGIEHAFIRGYIGPEEVDRGEG